MSLDILKGSFFSVAHAVMAILGGSLTDSLFDTSSDETPVETMLWLTAQTATAGFILGSLTTISYSGYSIETDPTGGAFISIPFILTQKNYLSRISKLTDGIYTWIGTNAPAAPSKGKNSLQ